MALTAAVIIGGCCPASWQGVGCMAVARTLVGQGWGRAVARRPGAGRPRPGRPRVLLHRTKQRCRVLPPRRFCGPGEPFDEVGIAHITMVLGL